MFKRGDEPHVQISISVPESLAEFINKSVESGKYMWAITYMNPLKPGTFEHARTIQNFQIPEILGALEKHKQQFSELIIGPYMQRESGVIVDDSGAVSEDQPQAAGLRVINIKPPAAGQEAAPENGQNKKGHPGWE